MKRITLPDWLFPIGVVVVVAVLAYAVGYYHASPPSTTWIELRRESIQGNVLSVHYWAQQVISGEEELKVGGKHFGSEILYVGDSYDEADIVEAKSITQELLSYQKGKKILGITQVNLFRSDYEYSWITLDK